MKNYHYTVMNGDVPLAVRVHRATEDPFERQPAVLVLGSWLTVKEQMADTYARALAGRGYTALTFDFSGFGSSGGTLRQTEIPVRKMSDIAAVVDWISTLAIVSPGGPGVVGICASAQYALQCLTRGMQVQSFASVAGWFHDAPTIGSFYGGAEGVAQRLERASSASQQFSKTNEMSTVPAYAPGDDRAGMFIEMDYYGSSSRGAVPEWKNEMTEITWGHWLTFDGLDNVEAVSVPTLFVHSDDAVFPDNVKSIAQRIDGSDVRWGEGQQIEFYDQPSQVDFAIEAIDGHFDSTMGK